MRYRLLVLDHDDTIVDSTATIHYPAFTQAMKVLRPEVKMTLEEYFLMNNDPGIVNYYEQVVHLQKEEKKIEFAIWQEYIASKVPSAFPGIKGLMVRFKKEGGYIAVISTNRKETILRDFAHNDLPLPDAIYGSELPKEQQKPSPYPLLDALSQFHVDPQEALVVDDLGLGHAMAKSCGVPSFYSFWVHELSSLRDKAKEAGIPYGDNVSDLAHYLFD